MKTKGEKLMDELIEAAKNWGYMEDQGCGSAVPAAQEAFDKARIRLDRYIRKLENARE